MLRNAVGLPLRASKPNCVCWPRFDAYRLRSPLKSPSRRFDVSRPTTSEKITRIRNVRTADTAARRQRTGQRFGVRTSRIRSSRFIAWRSHDVAGAALCVKDSRLAARLELSPHVRDEDVDGVGHRHGVITPDLLEQPLARDDEALVAHQVLEQLELAVRELDRPVAAEDLAGVWVQSQVRDRERRGTAWRTAAHQGAHASEELLALERLDQVVVGA